MQSITTMCETLKNQVHLNETNGHANGAMQRWCQQVRNCVKPLASDPFSGQPAASTGDGAVAAQSVFQHPDGQIWLHRSRLGCGHLQTVLTL